MLKIICCLPFFIDQAQFEWSTIPDFLYTMNGHWNNSQFVKEKNDLWFFSLVPTLFLVFAHVPDSWDFRLDDENENA